MATQPFKVVIVGGGPIAFFAAHCFKKANIDFVILEAHREIAKEIGAGFSLGAPQLRVFHQLGILPQMLKIKTELILKRNFLPDGYKFFEVDFFKPTRENFGTGANIVHRSTFLRTFYEALPDDAKAKVHTGKKVTDIQTDEHGVTVTCADESVFHGHLVLGADGTHSVTRRIMRKLALSADPQRDWDPEQPFESGYRVTWACSESYTKRAGTSTEVQSKDRVATGFFGKDQAWLFLMGKTGKLTRERTTFTEEETRAHAESFSDWVLDDGLKVGDFLAKSFTLGSSLVYEGDCKHWTHGRIALAGDSVHTWAPNAGRGLNNGFIDIVILANNLNCLLNGGSNEAGLSRLPTFLELEAVLQKYEAERGETSKNDSGLSVHVLRWQTWENFWYYLIGRFLFSSTILTRFLLNNLDAKRMRAWAILDYIKVKKEPFQGRVSWANSIVKDQDQPTQ